MAEILALVAIVLAIAAMNRNGKNTAKLTEEIRKLRQELDTIRSGGTVLAARPAEGGEALASGLAEASPGDADEATAEPPFPSPWLRARATVDEAGSATEAATPETAAASAEALAAAVNPPERESLESRIGARWAVWVGGLALALGGVFMVKYAVESGVLSPAVRLALAALFGLVLVAAGEVIRRRGQPAEAVPFGNAMIPGVLTAAGALTLFGVTYAAHGFYGFIGAPLSFLTLAAIALATIALSLLHGQALAGLGLLGSMATPLLVSTAEPDPWRLFAYLSIAWLATAAASRLRRWRAVPALANVAIGLWALIYLAAAEPIETLPVTLALLVVLAGAALLWPGGGIDGAAATDHPAGAGSETAVPDGEAGHTDAAVADRIPAAAAPGAGSRSAVSRWRRVLAPAFLAVSLSAALAVSVPAIVLAFLHPLPLSAAAAFVALVLALAVLGAGRSWALYPAVLGNLCALAGTMVLAGISGRLALGALVALPGQPDFDTAVPVAAGAGPVDLILLLAAGLSVAGGGAIWLWKDRAPAHAALGGVLMAVFPVAIATVSFLAFGNLTFDLRHGLFALVLGLAYLGGAEVHSRSVPEGRAPVPQWTLVAGGFAFLVLALFAWTDGLATTLLVAVLGFAMVLATRVRPWAVLPWMMAGAALVVAVRIGWEPTIVGAANLSKTPVFNQLLPGYGIPALLLAGAAWLLRRWPGERVRNLLQALACLFVLLAVAILVRHAMNGGVLDSAAPTLGEQAIYTLLAAGASAVLMTFDLKQPSPVFRYGSMVIGVLSMLSILSAHFFALNPYFSGELTGRWPFFNLLLIGYLLPGLAFAGLAWYARGRRPATYVTLLALTGALLVFAWVTLSVRRYWHGEGIASWKGFLEGETYTYSVVWLLLGVALLALGSRFAARSLRLASAALVLIAVVKVFLVDMSNLQGILRALSFIGLGAVLIGIGLFYQRILSAGTGIETSRQPEPPPQ
ncbi:DUF2339 domain-containing protein [Rhizobium sp. GN54]|uniref:DUF2339 domain-containing protein n=1 Tax=Rhizobium sp. GN54 TaxID=2898150 RepID=UPI001E2A74E4|nr:DUF2339 domain-containing protein [Rhizobium sp. GN54]MCD2181091.1 DUF2339 domain-containing protein [Rhizobium sp. GN54]